MNAKRILITTESHEVFILRTDSAAHAYGQCPVCKSEVEILTLDRAISLSGIRTGDLVRLTESGSVHSIETTFGHLLICKESLNRLSSSRLDRGGNESIDKGEFD